MGLLTSIAGVMTFGLLSPLGLLLSLFAMRRGPRTAATLGTVLGGLGTVFIGLVVWGAASAVSHAQEANDAAVTNAVMQVAVTTVDEYRTEHKELPNGIEGNMLLIDADLNDAWGESLRYEPEGQRYLIRSAGPDGEFETSDDLTRS